MKVYKTEVKRSPWAQEVWVSKTKIGQWIIDRGTRRSILPPSTFNTWDHAEWTGNAWANEEYLETLKEIS
jgi:hypothetical protein